MLITMKKLMDVAKKEGGFAVPAPNVFSMETTEAAYQAAREMQAPVILNVWDAGAEWIEKQANLALYFEKKYPDVIAALTWTMASLMIPKLLPSAADLPR